MTPGGFIRRLQSGKTVHCTYRVEDRAGLISAWPYGEAFVLTWEECRDGDQYNEYAYTRDERHQFETADEVLTFVEGNGYPASGFRP